MIAAACGGVRVVSLYAPNGRVVDSVFYEAKLAWYRPAGPLARAGAPIRHEPLVLGGDFNVAPEDADVWDPVRLPRRHPRVAAGARGVRPAAPTGAWSTRTACITPSRVGIPGGTTARETSTRTSACGSITCW